MDYIKLGTSTLEVSKVCLGTMTYGEQNTEAESHDMLDYAFSRGINFIDTAEMYPVPHRAETNGNTERFIGSWLKKQDRSKVILATKVVGIQTSWPWVRNGHSKHNDYNINEAVDLSLKNLNTDYIDLYQIHWPDRNTVFFGEEFFNRERQWQETPIEEILESLNKLVKAGKIREIGISNETSWGISEYIKQSETHNLPKIACVQNAYNLAERNVETSYLDETLYREQVGLTVYSPLAHGHLSGKYIADKHAKGRSTLFTDEWPRYNKPVCLEAYAQYHTVAQELGISLHELALGWCYTRPFIDSTIISATSLTQLKQNIDVYDTVKESDLWRESQKQIATLVNTVHRKYTNVAHTCD